MAARALCAAGYCSHDDAFETFHLSAEQQAVFADEESKALMIGAFDILVGNVHGIEAITDAFKTGGGVDYGDFHPCVFQGTARFFKPSYKSNLLEKWLPKIPAATEKLENGGRLCDVGCGKGLSTLLMAEHYPKASFVGIDIHAPSIDEANEEAHLAGLSDRLCYDAADAESYGGEYDVITFFDCLHDMGDPLSAPPNTPAPACAKGGMVILIEPSAADHPKRQHVRDGPDVLLVLDHGLRSDFQEPKSWPRSRRSSRTASG